MNNTISVIIPVYNVEKYLSECLDSVLNQTYTDLEVILIDDGSKDNSGRICDEYAKKDSRIKVIHQQNGGAAAAKNSGLRIATGKYLSFVDSDDYIEKDAYEFMVNKLNEHNAEVIQCAFKYVYLDKSEDQYLFGQQVLAATDYMKLYVSDWTAGLMTDKLYIRSISDGIFFEEGNRIDDEYFTYRLIMNANKVVREPKIIYNYRKRKSSVMCSPESAQRIIRDRVDFLWKRRINVGNRFPELKKLFDDHYLNAMIVLSKDSNVTEETILLIKQQLKEYFTHWRNTFPSIGLWKGILKICFQNTRKILEQKDNADIQLSDEGYFD